MDNAETSSRLIRLSLLLVVGIATWASFTQQAQAAATLLTSKACYGDGDPIRFTGSGFVAGQQVGFSLNGEEYAGTRPSTVSAFGSFSNVFRPFEVLEPQKRRYDPLIAHALTPEGENGQALASTSVLRTRLSAYLTPGSARPTAVRRINASGFTTGKTLYVHVVKGKRVRTMRLASLHGACRTASLKKRLFTKKQVRGGMHLIQFDTARKYSSKTVQKVRFRITIYLNVKR